MIVDRLDDRNGALPCYPRGRTLNSGGNDKYRAPQRENQYHTATGGFAD